MWKRKQKLEVVRRHLDFDENEYDLERKERGRTKLLAALNVNLTGNCFQYFHFWLTEKNFHIHTVHNTITFHI